jgi:hypothetical protein
MKLWRSMVPLVALGVFSSGGCSSGSSFGGAIDAPTLASNGASSGGSSSGTSGGNGDFAEDAGGAMLPPEMKSENNFRAPVATGNIVWSANPTSGRVAYIDATTFSVQTAAAGNGPTYLAALVDPKNPSDDVAIVLNVLSDDATLLRVHQGTLSTQTFASTEDANSWAISPLGRWAIAWTDATGVSNPAPTQGFQKIAVMDLTLSRSTTLAVGFRPVQIAFAADDSHAFAVTEDGISVLDLTPSSGPVVIRQDPLSAASPPDAGAVPGDANVDGAAAGDAQTEAGAPGDAGDAGDAGDGGIGDGAAMNPPANPTGAPDVSFTPDGAYALVRRDGLAAITVDSLTDGMLTTIPLPNAPTDLTISPKGDFALAVLRDTATVAVLPIPGVLTDPASVTTISIAGETVGRAIVTNQGKTALLFTTVAAIDRLTVLTMQPPSFRTIVLHAPVQAVFPTADGANAIVLHQVSPTAGSMVKGAFSIVPIEKDLSALIESLPAAPTAVAISPMNDRAIISTRDDGSATYGLYMALMPSQDVRTYTLASPPISVGIAAGAGRGYVAQDYSEGRITFVDLSEGGVTDGGEGFAARTISGFELNARVVVGGSN